MNGHQCSTMNDHPWHIMNVKGDCLILVGHFIFWTLLLAIIEARATCSTCCKRRKKAKSSPVNVIVSEESIKQTDVDVAKEAERVKSLEIGEELVKVQDLRKEYRAPCGECSRRRKVVAVEKLSFGLNTGECFALLGVNGAGKSTTFKTLMNEVDSTAGIVTIG